MDTSTIIVIVAVVVFLIVDLILIVFIIVESKKYHECVNKESPFCLDFSCPYPFDESYVPFTNTNLRVPGLPVNFSTEDQIAPTSSIAANKCAGYPYRLIDPTVGPTDDNIECRNLSFAGMQTEKATSLKT